MKRVKHGESIFFIEDVVLIKDIGYKGWFMVRFRQGGEVLIGSEGGADADRGVLIQKRVALEELCTKLSPLTIEL